MAMLKGPKTVVCCLVTTKVVANLFWDWEFYIFRFSAWFSDFVALLRCRQAKLQNCCGPSSANILSLLFSWIFCLLWIELDKGQIGTSNVTLHHACIFQVDTLYENMCNLRRTYEPNVHQLVSWFPCTFDTFLLGTNESNVHQLLSWFTCTFGTFFLATNESNVHQLLSWFPTTFGTFLLATIPGKYGENL